VNKYKKEDIMAHTSYKELKKYSYFSGLSDGALEALARKLTVVEFPAGTSIIRENAPADSYYLVSKGELDVLKRTKWGQSAKISIVGRGEGFGEMALLTCSHRFCSVSAKTDVTLLKLTKKDFEEIITNDAVFLNMMEEKVKDYSQYHKLKTLQPLALLEPEKMLALVEKLKEETYHPGENIITQGEKGHLYYIIKSGRAAVIRKEKDREPEQVAVLGSGEGFGEEALIREKPRSATVKAIDETTVLVLDQADFDQILRGSFLEWDFPEDIPLEKREQYVFIDARIPPEYEEEHIEGAVNIPLEVLRQKYAELDPSQEYYTYCTSDSRGMTAAFLLKSQGFKAKSIRGGLSAWAGPVAHGKDGIHTPCKIA
jgi:CRP-like cAMP-binding protein